MIKLNLNFLVLVTLLYRIRGDFVKIQEQDKIGSKQLTENPAESLSETVITPAVIVDGEKFDDNKVGELVVRNSYSNWVWRDNDIEIRTESVRVKRAVGCNVALDESFDYELTCLSCFANGTSKADEDCYKARRIPVITCAKREKCYTEIHPDFLRRGCKMQSLLNRTHVCKCPLCNDKPFNDTSYYEYKKIKDWKYDNDRLEVPLIGIDLFCKLCTTNGTNHTVDETCKIGTNANSTVCDRNQLCYMNADGKNNYVSRGCINRPIYNSMYFFCQASLCNNKTFHNFKLTSNELRIPKISSTAAYFTSSIIVHCDCFLLYYISKSFF